eukprot:jgi/Chlat1/5047/Chrsp33S05056
MAATTAPPKTTWPSQLEANRKILSDDEVKLVDILLNEQQAHLFEHWSPAGENDNDKHRFLEQVAKLEANYVGGVGKYISNARELLAASREGKNPFDGYTPKVPEGENLTYGDEQFQQLEDIGLPEARDAAFVLVAGGLGERLGYSGIKIALLSETITEKPFLQQYIESILALEKASNKAAGGSPKHIPLAIMTSDDTHARTTILLESHNYFGMDKSNLSVVKQEKVACLADNDAHIALDPKDPYEIQTKPHGHGDVHALLHQSGLLDKWMSEKRKWVVFFQDTNALVFRAIPSALGVSKSRGFEVNSLAVPRRAKESIGAITELTHTDGSKITINVEYNQLDPLLRATTFPDGDVNDPKTGFSPFPGNINQLVFALEPYAHTLDKTKGLITEFVNPKYADSSKTKFKSSTRLECMMQDYPKSLGPEAKVGFTVLDVWVAYSPVKNNPADAAAKASSNQATHSATSGEMDQYAANSKILAMAGASIDAPKKATYNGIEVEVYPRILLSPDFGITFKDIKSKVVGGSKVKVSQKSVLVIEGEDIYLEDMNVDGALILKAAPGAKVHVAGLNVSNGSFEFVPVDFNDESQPEEFRVRGFKVARKENEEKTFDQPGEYTLP